MTTNLLSLPTTCPICKRSENVEIYRANDDGTIGLVCKTCGRSYLTFQVFEKIADLPTDDPILHRLASHIRKENLVSRYPHIADSEWPNLLASLGFGEAEKALPPTTSERPKTPPQTKAITPTAPDPWWKVYRRNMTLTIVGYGIVLAFVVSLGARSKWAEITTAYFAIANLVVLWWYAHSTRKQVEIGLQQHGLALRQRRETNKPFVVLERLIDPVGYAHYAIRNIGPGVAVNVFHVIPQPGTSSKTRRAGIARFESVGALGSGAQRILPDALERPLRDAKGESLGAVLVAEGIATRTARWTCTLNALAPSGEVLCRIQALRVQDDNIEISDVLDRTWADLGLAQLELQEDAKRHS